MQRVEWRNSLSLPRHRSSTKLLSSLLRFPFVDHHQHHVNLEAIETYTKLGLIKIQSLAEERYHGATASFRLIRVRFSKKSVITKCNHKNNFNNEIR